MRQASNKKSAAQHRQSGTYNATKHSTDRLVSVPILKQMPPPPKDFDKEHAAKWEEVCRLLHEAGILAKQDLDAIRTYCETSIMQRRSVDMMKGGDMIDEEKGRVSAAFLLYERCDKILKPLREQFGFTPRARQSINLAPEEAEADIIGELLNAN